MVWYRAGRIRPGLKARPVIAWGGAFTRSPRYSMTQRSPRCKCGTIRTLAHAGEPFRPCRPRGSTGDALPGPPLAVLAPTQAITFRAFSPSKPHSKWPHRIPPKTARNQFFPGRNCFSRQFPPVLDLGRTVARCRAETGNQSLDVNTLNRFSRFP